MVLTYSSLNFLFLSINKPPSCMQARVYTWKRIKWEKSVYPDFKTYCITTVITTAVLVEGETLDQWNNGKSRSRPTQICPIDFFFFNLTCIQLIFDRGAKAIVKRLAFKKWYWNNWTLMDKKMNINPSLTPLTKINWKWFMDLNVKL